MSPRPTLSEIAHHAEPLGLDVLGGFHGTKEDNLPPGCKALVLLGPGPLFWPVVTASPEFRGGAPDPIDRWSKRVISKIATDLGALALFPFGPPPYHPFFAWGLRPGTIWHSPVGLAIHEKYGLFVSFRGALAFSHHIDLEEKFPPRPCDSCSQPCLSACPVSALGADGYDVPACKTFLDSAPGADCMNNGCAVRRACPVGQGVRAPEQSAFHMAHFHDPSRGT